MQSQEKELRLIRGTENRKEEVSVKFKILIYRLITLKGPHPKLEEKYIKFSTKNTLLIKRIQQRKWIKYKYQAIIIQKVELLQLMEEREENQKVY